ncbi:MAG: hypothetical protein Q9191_002449 [Dirinaria sp. TL-2023a]
MTPSALPRIVSPSLLSYLRGHPQLPPHTWYFIAGVTLSAINRSDEIPLVFEHALEKGGGKEERIPQHDEQLVIARKMREGLVKAAVISGLPKTINALSSLKSVTPSSLIDEPLQFSPTARPVEIYDIPSSTILHRGQTFFGQVRRK